MSGTKQFKALIGHWNYGDDPNCHLQGYEKPEEAKAEVFRQFDEWRGGHRPKPTILGINWGRKYCHGGNSLSPAPVYDYWHISILYY